VEADKPFFLVVAPNAPHSNVAVDDDLSVNNTDSIRFGAPVSAERHKHLFKDVKVPRTPHFNPEEVRDAGRVCFSPRTNVFRSLLG
jgi:hypothetical protein